MTGGSSLVHPVRDLMIRRFGEDKIQVGMRLRVWRTGWRLRRGMFLIDLARLNQLLSVQCQQLGS